MADGNILRIDLPEYFGVVMNDVIMSEVFPHPYWRIDGRFVEAGISKAMEQVISRRPEGSLADVMDEVLSKEIKKEEYSGTLAGVLRGKKGRRVLYYVRLGTDDYQRVGVYDFDFEESPHARITLNSEFLHLTGLDPNSELDRIARYFRSAIERYGFNTNKYKS